MLLVCLCVVDHQFEPRKVQGNQVLIRVFSWLPLPLCVPVVHKCKSQTSLKSTSNLTKAILQIVEKRFHCRMNNYRECCILLQSYRAL